MRLGLRQPRSIHFQNFSILGRDDEKPEAQPNADVAVTNRYVNDQTTVHTDTTKKTGAQEKCEKPGVPWAASGFLNRKDPARKNTP